MLENTSKIIPIEPKSIKVELQESRGYKQGIFIWKVTLMGFKGNRGNKWKALVYHKPTTEKWHRYHFIEVIDADKKVEILSKKVVDFLNQLELGLNKHQRRKIGDNIIKLIHPQTLITTEIPQDIINEMSIAICDLFKAGDTNLRKGKGKYEGQREGSTER